MENGRTFDASGNDLLTIDLSKIPVPLSCTQDRLNEIEEEPLDYEILLASTWNKAVDTLDPDGNDLGQLKTHIADLKEEIKEEKAEHQSNWELAEENLQLALRKRFPDANQPELDAVANWVITSLGRLGPSFIEENTTPPRLWNEIQNPDRWRGFARHFTGRKQRISMLEFCLAVYNAVRKKYKSPEGVSKFPDPEELRTQGQEFPHSNSEPENQKEASPAPSEEPNLGKIMPDDVFKSERERKHGEALVKACKDYYDKIGDKMGNLIAYAGEASVKSVQKALRRASRDHDLPPLYEHGNPISLEKATGIALEKDASKRL